VLYIELSGSKSDIKERVDIAARSPANNWLRESINNTRVSSKEKKASNAHPHPKMVDFHSNNITPLKSNIVSHPMGKY
jgi:hypothetical protein